MHRYCTCTVDGCTRQDVTGPSCPIPSHPPARGGKPTRGYFVLAKQLFSVACDVVIAICVATSGILLGSGPAVVRIRSHTHTVPDTTKSPKWVAEEAERGHVETMQGRCEGRMTNARNGRWRLMCSILLMPRPQFIPCVPPTALCTSPARRSSSSGGWGEGCPNLRSFIYPSSAGPLSRLDNLRHRLPSSAVTSLDRSSNRHFPLLVLLTVPVLFRRACDPSLPRLLQGNMSSGGHHQISHKPFRQENPYTAGERGLVSQAGADGENL